jgi:hypothetical protein
VEERCEGWTATHGEPCHPYTLHRPPRFLVALALEPGTPALEPRDPHARNGHFTSALLRHLRAGGSTKDARVLLGDVVQAVEVATECRQTPSVSMCTMHGASVPLLPPLTGMSG